MTMRRIAAFSGFLLAVFALAGCATATIEDAVPAGALVQSSVESSNPVVAPSHVVAPGHVIGDGHAVAATLPAGTYPNLNVAPATAAPQITEQKKAADRAELRAHQSQLAAEGRRLGAPQDPAALGAYARERAAAAQGSAAPDDGDALRRLAERQIEETLKEIEGR